MRLTWYGHAAFLVEHNGKRIIHDPFSPQSGYDPIDEPADILVMSQEDDVFHSHAASVLGQPTVINGRHMLPDGVTVDGIHFRSVLVWEDLARTRNPNGMIHYTVDGVSLAHMGDLGHPLNENEIAPLRGVDVLLAITGGVHTIAIDALWEAIQAIRPRLVVPMHYQTGKVRLNIKPIEEFLALTPEGWRTERRDTSTVELTPELLPAEPTILLLRSAR